jgi:methionine-gamma-lyase
MGSLISFELKGGIEAGRKVLASVKIPALAVSLGGVESLIQHPASMTHAAVPRESRLAAGISDGLVRLAVGCEAKEDLVADMKQALDGLLA